MAADALNHFLSTQRLVIVSRPDFAIRKHLQENKIDPKTRLNVYDACEILLTIQSSIVSKKGKYDKKQQCVQKIMHQDKIRLRKTHEKQMANRKAVISFNILGEKSIRWETIEDANLTEICTQQPLDTGGVQSSGESQEQRSSKSPSVRVPTDQTVPISDKRSDIVTHDKKHRSLPQAAAVTLGDDEVDGVSATMSLKRRRNRKLSVAESMGLKMRDDFPDPDLVNRLKLSKRFQSKWSGGYCWCTSSLELRVMWIEDSNPEEEAPLSACEECGKRMHVLKLNRSGYKPHFSLRMILGIIVDVYDELMGPSHNLLFKSTTTRGSAGASEDTDAVSAHSALFRVLTKKFGMPKVVEGKIKLLLLSITHFVHEVDAIAVFGELLGIFARNQSYDDTHVPDEMVALCVSCYSWFYSREMVINGESILGSGRNVGQNMHSLQGNASITEIEHGKHNNWQFAKLENALLCAEEMLMYPLVSPGYLRNILLYAVEYAQAYPTKPQLAEEDNEGVEADTVKRVMWLEVHRFLRLLVGEWKQQSTEFRVVEQTLFIQPLADTATTLSAAETRAIVIEKLRLILSCFIFYDHDREGVMTVEDFTNILRKLRYLWPNEDVTAEEAASSSKDSLTFENTILAARRRFADLEGDGQICYLDFWAMLYIVGVKTLSLLKFREIPSFCRDYKLEISSDLHGLLLCYMQRSSTMLLPQGFQLGKSSLDQRTSIQHQRRVGGLHDGLFRMPNRLGTSLSLQELLAQSDPQQTQKRGVRDQIYLDGSTPSLRQNASMTAMDRFRPVSHDAGVPENSQFRGLSPVGLARNLELF
uniref:EF-hand domain-containing protein n=1 Tax=Globisporangium ultimum (strain ATCC 200006 / CBS 805.95 / DAOM BR144) TaxID=431595 RepID=K3X7W4_GLOUD